ncbi:MAG: peptidylprolyl isomerase [Saprospiraceae bacterium]
MNIRSITLLALLALAQFAFAQRAVIDKVVAMVGSEVILLSEVEEQYSAAIAQNPTLPADIRCEIVDQLLVSKLLVNQAKLDSVLVSEEEVEEQLNARIERILAYMNDDVTQFEAYYGQTITQVKEQFREDLRAQILSERMRGQVLANVKVTPSEVKTFFERIPRDSLPYFSSEVEVGEIVYVPPVNAVERQRAIDKLNKLRAQITAGETTFYEAAQKFSDDGSARIGGDLGWAKRGKFVPEFEAAAYQLENGQMSEVVESEFGFHLIQLEERRGNSIHVRHILVRPEITDEDLVMARQHLDSVRQLIVNDSLTFSLAVKKFGSDKEQSYNNDGRMINPATGNTFFEVADLDPDIYFTIDTMKIGDISAPFAFAAPAGETFYRIVQLQSRSDPHKANLQQDYDKIQEATKQSKQNDHLSTWIEEKVRATYVLLDSRYDTCPNLSKWREDSFSNE